MLVRQCVSGEIPLLHRRYCCEGPALLWQPALRVRLFCPVGVRDVMLGQPSVTERCKIEKLRTAGLRAFFVLNETCEGY